MNWIIRYRKMVWVFITLLVLTGIFTYLQLPKREIPEINVNVASITTSYPGATPQEIEQSITTPLENEIEGINGIDSYQSASTTGFSSLTVTLEGGVDTNTTYSKIRQAVSDVSRTFPENANDSNVETDLQASAVASYHLQAENHEELYNLQDEVELWKEQLESIGDVDYVQVKGLPSEELLVNLDLEQLNENAINPGNVIDAINQELKPGAIGTVEQNDQRYQLLIKKASDWQQLEDLSVGKNGEGESVRLGDIGSISLTLKDEEDIITYKEKPSLSLTVLAKEGVNISALQDEITTKVDELSSELPESISVEQFYTQSTIIEEVFTNLLSSFGFSLLAVLVVMLLGLPVSSAILVAIAIPISVLVGLIPLPYTGVDLNQISIIGIIIAIGILVDDAIVVNDNIQRRYQLGDNALQGVIQGVKEVRLSIFTSTLMIVFSFFPLTFLSGTNGDFIRALPMTLICTIIASTILSLTLIPTVQYGRKKRNKKMNSEGKVGLLGGLFQKLETGYADSVLPKVSKRPVIFGVSGILLCVALLFLATRIPFEFFPEADRQEVTVSVTYSQETPIEKTTEQLQTMEQYIQEETDKITETAVFAGNGMPALFSSGLERTGEYTGQLLVRVDKDKTSASSFIDEWEPKLRDEFKDAEIFLETIVSGPPPSPPVEVQIQGPELDQLLSIARDLKGDLEGISTSNLVTLNMNNEQPALQYTLDRDFMAENSISLQSVTSQLQIANTGIPLSTIDTGSEQLPMRLLVDDGDSDGLDLSELTVVSSAQSQSGPPTTYTLDEFISTEETNQVGTIPHVDGERTITLRAYGEEGSTFQSDAADTVDAFEESLPEDYAFTQSGQSDAATEFFIEVSKLFLIVLFLIYLVIAVQFNSLLMPFLITATVFLAITGAIVGLFVFQEPLSFLAVLGIVSLSGIVVRNSVILVEFTEQNLKQSMAVEEAIKEAGRTRIRPIVLTTLTSIAALVPIIFSGDQLFQPLAVSIVAGLAFSTLLTLLLLPAFYLILYKVTGRHKKEQPSS
ncbi:multidrug transporter [Pontibacillus halophilus JSM 076056 = DSM 19796]|uniref:Multidrug transporter n=1 Tax=Pontibacillus halophilus JSM 076056 = DSM 19796 TaxID=1385510 RepID=A0A0A5I8G0_9BACI|nr:efflux RND transporter permease subunit [Pontibacillus halophilus]KGX92127.1 multidrug transporter [Pontibacillus halophilus JSM 076056 = DSM 19796]